MNVILYNMSSNLRDLFTEKSSEISMYLDFKLNNYTNKVDEGLYECFFSPVKFIDVDYFNVLINIEKYSKQGKDHILFKKYQEIHGNTMSDNIVVPYLDITNCILTDLILINDEKDSMRLAKKHIKKMPNFTPLLYDSLISTTDTNQWKSQRMNYVNAFSPIELNKILQISRNRAEKCVDFLLHKSNNGKEKINISEFFLNETMAQLQLAMFGLSNNFQEKTNKKIRDAFGGKGKGYAREYAKSLIEEIEKSNGPLSLAFKERNNEMTSNTENYGNALIFSFAGHDTTGHTLTWLIYELCKNQTWQRKLQREVDNFWEIKKNNKITTNDFRKLPFMTRCIMETLRLHTAVPNGSFRELMEDDYIRGKNGMIKVPKGTYIQIFNYSRHLNKNLWGEDAEDFNPDREFKDNEIWNNDIYAFYNPSTERFSPFTYPPRDCIGKNFSQMEMRLILLYILKHFHFILDDKQNKEIFNNIEINKATMGPVDLYNPINKDDKGMRPFNIGMYVHLIPRKKLNSHL